MENLADDLIDAVVKKVSAHKRALVTLAVILLAVFSARVIDYVQGNITGPVNDALASGISGSKFATAVALGVSSGLSAPGLTMLVLFALAKVVVALSGAEVDAPVLAIAAAINAALTVPDLLVWNSVFSALGSQVLPGGRYVRPFLAGSIPWMLSVPIIYFVSYGVALQAHALLLR